MQQCRKDGIFYGFHESIIKQLCFYHANVHWKQQHINLWFKENKSNGCCLTNRATFTSKFFLLDDAERIRFRKNCKNFGMLWLRYYNTFIKKSYFGRHIMRTEKRKHEINNKYSKNTICVIVKYLKNLYYFTLIMWY